MRLMGVAVAFGVRQVRLLWSVIGRFQLLASAGDYLEPVTLKHIRKNLDYESFGTVKALWKKVLHKTS
jgi:hypothetical protein